MPRRITTFVDGDSPAGAGLDANYQGNQLIPRTLLRPANQTSWPNWPGSGMIARLAFIPNLLRDPGDPPDPPALYLAKVLDTEVDWRDRLLVVMSQVTDASLGGSWDGPIVPGVTTDRFFVRHDMAGAEHAFVGYTRTGAAMGAPGGNHIVLSTYVALFARSTDGALMVQRAPGDPSADPLSLWFYILATEPTGQRTSPAASPVIVPTDATPIRPHQLNGFQDRVMIGQCRESATVSVDAYPVGPKGSGDRTGTTEGKTYIPELWTKWGAKDRQTVVGGRFRFFSAQVGDATAKVLDGEQDWRDRIVWAIGRWSATLDLEPGAADDKLHQDAGTDAYNVGRYTGSGESANANSDEGYHLLVTGSSFPGISFYARDDDGSLMVANDTGGTIKITGMLWATPQFGIRS